MTAYSRDRANSVPTRFIDVSEHPRIKQIALGIDVQDGQTAITVHGYTAKGETIVLEHAVVESGSAIVHYDIGGQEYAGRLLIGDEVGSAEWRGAKGEPERYVRYRQASRERAAKAKLALDRYEVEVREGRRQENGGERLRLRLAHTEAHHALLIADHARAVRASA